MCGRGVDHVDVGDLRLMTSETDQSPALVLKVKILPDLEVLYKRPQGHLTALIEEDKGTLTNAKSSPDLGVLVIGGFATMCRYIHAASAARDALDDFHFSDLNNVILPLHFRSATELWPMYLCFYEGAVCRQLRRLAVYAVYNRWVACTRRCSCDGNYSWCMCSSRR